MSSHDPGPAITLPARGDPVRLLLSAAPWKAAAFLGSFPLMALVGSEFVPEADLSELQVQLKTPVGSSLDMTQAKARQAEAAVDVQGEDRQEGRARHPQERPERAELLGVLVQRLGPEEHLEVPGEVDEHEAEQPTQ